MNDLAEAPLRIVAAPESTAKTYHARFPLGDGAAAEIRIQTQSGPVTQQQIDALGRYSTAWAQAIHDSIHGPRPVHVSWLTRLRHAFRVTPVVSSEVRDDLYRASALREPAR
jgi:hypothetical protein